MGIVIRENILALNKGFKSHCRTYLVHNRNCFCYYLFLQLIILKSLFWELKLKIDRWKDWFYRLFCSFFFVNCIGVCIINFKSKIILYLNWISLHFYVLLACSLIETKCDYISTSRRFQLPWKDEWIRGFFITGLS